MISTNPMCIVRMYTTNTVKMNTPNTFLNATFLYWTLTLTNIHYISPYEQQWNLERSLVHSDGNMTYMAGV